MSLSFSRFCAAMDAAGIEVGVVLTPAGRHVVRLTDDAAPRRLELAVERGFDATALIACHSLALRPESPLAREWPELVAVARDAVGLSDVEVSDRGRAGRRS